MKNKKMVRVLSLLIGALMIMTSLPFASAMAAGWNELIPSKSETGANYRFGIVSDSHLGPNATKTNNLDTALSAFSSLGDVDALVMNGDMVYAPAAANVKTDKYVYEGAEVNVPAALYSKLKSVVAENGEFTFAGTQTGDVFTADSSQGKPIIYSMGNHGFAENDRDKTRAAAAKQLFKEQTGRNSDYVMNVGGYTFIMSSAQDFFNDFKQAEEFVKEQILAAEAYDPSNKPIFYLQHEGVHGTVVGSNSTATGNTDSFKAFLNEHPRVVVLSAHTHAAAEDPRTIWQDGFTAISSAQLGGGSISSHGGKYSMGADSTGSQCLMMDVKENSDNTELKIYRLNFLTGALIGKPWEVTIDGTKDNFKYTAARYENPSIAKYDDDANLTVVSNSRQGFKFSYTTTDVTIDAGEDYLQDAFVHSYRVVVKNTDANVIVQNFKVFADIFESDDSKLSSYTVTLPNQLDRATNYEISVYALTPFTAGSSIETLEAKGITPVKYSFKTSEELTNADKALIRTQKNVNVALGKKVIAGNPNHTEEVLAKLVNGQMPASDIIHANAGGSADGSYVKTQVALPSGKLVDSATHQKDDWFIIDLGRRYDVSEVKVWSRQDSYNKIYMQYFDIEASNVEDFAEYVTLGGVGSNAPSDKATPITISGDGNSYRYIRLRRTGNSAYGYGEIEVFADVVTQEVSQNRQAEVNFATYPSMGAKYTVDGILASNANCWLIESLKSTDPEPPYNLVVDLEQDYPIGFIEMFGRYGTDADVYRNNWNVYGYTNEQGNPGTDIKDFSEGTLLWSVTSPYPQITNGTNPEGLKAPIAADGKYRYIVFSKTKKELAAIGEIRAEIILPQVTKLERAGSKSLSLSFSEKMDAESIKNGISVVSDSGAVLNATEVLVTDASLWDGGYDVVMNFAETLPTSGISLNVNGNVKALNGASFVEEMNMPISSKTIEINKAYAETIENVNVALNKTVYANTLVASGDSVEMNPNAIKLTNGIFREYVQPPAYASGNVTLPSGDVVKASTQAGADWYIVDLGQRYNINEIRLYSRGDETTVTDNWMSKFDIEVSNSITFDNYLRVGGIGNTIAGTEVTSSATPYVATVDEETAYRYVRVRKTGWTYYGWSEIQVYADVKATEVSRNAKATIDEGYTNAFGAAATQKVTDGVKNNDYAGVLFEGITSKLNPPYNVLVDLGEEYPIGLVQMWGRGDENSSYASVDAYRRNWTIYGASADNAPTCAQDTANSVVITNVGSTPYDPSGFKGLTDGNMYRYITFSKITKELGCVGEIKASVLNPEVYAVDINEDGTITINFTDKMEAETLISDNFTIDGVTLENPDITSGWDGGYSVTFDVVGTIKNGATLKVSENVRNISGIEMAEDAEFVLETGVVFTKEDGIVEANIIAEENCDAVLYVAVKNTDNRLVNIYMSEKVALTEGKVATLKASGVTAAEGEVITAYLLVDGTIKPITECSVVE